MIRYGPSLGIGTSAGVPGTQLSRECRGHSFRGVPGTQLSWHECRGLSFRVGVAGVPGASAGDSAFALRVPGTQLSWHECRGLSFRVGVAGVPGTQLSRWGAASTRPLARDLLAIFLFACDHAALTGRLPLAMSLGWRGGVGSRALKIGGLETSSSLGRYREPPLKDSQPSPSNLRVRRGMRYCRC
jgi:hypothetical protein